MRSQFTDVRCVLTAAGVVLSAVVCGMVLWRAGTEFLLDLEVFQDAGRAFVAGADLYSEDFPTRSGFRFIYPPVAALLFAPLAPLSATVAQVAWTAATIVAVWAILAMVAGRARVPRPALVALALTGLVLLMEPLRSNLSFGQINVFLFLLVTADVLGFTPRRFRGVLLGLAAGIKITPAAFALLFLVRRDWAALTRSVATVIVTAVIGYLVRPAESVHFWTTEFFVTDRAGHMHFVPNQALSGLLARSGVPEHSASPVTTVFFLLTAAAATWGAWQLTRRGRELEAFLLVALGVFIASPVAVTHHWSGIIIALPLLLVLRETAVRVAVGLTVLVHLIGTHYAYEITAADPVTFWLQWLVGNLQGLTGIVAFAVLLASAARPSRSNVSAETDHVRRGDREPVGESDAEGVVVDDVEHLAGGQ